MKILLLNPGWLLKKEDADFFRISQPDSLGYIAAALKEAGHNVRLIDAASTGWKESCFSEGNVYFGMHIKKIIEEIRLFSPNLIGVPLISSFLKNNGFFALSKIKKAFPDILTVVGGAHATVAVEECLQKEFIDFVVIGEGEKTTLELANELSAKNPEFEKIDGLAFKRKNGIVINKKRELISNLDALPFPSRELYPMDNYFIAAKKLISTFALSTYGKKWATVITSRGCPYNCIFCSIYLSMGRKWRPRSPENVILEIEQLIQDYGIEYIAFLDDNMSLDKSRMKRICELIISRKLRIKWSTPNGLRADTLDESLLRLMKKSGCERIAVAAESGSQRVVDQIIGKNLQLTEVVRVVSMCKKIGLKVDCFFVMGLIGETKKDLGMTVDFARHLHKIGVSGLNIAIATPFPGTEFYKQCIEKKLISTNFDKFTMFRGDFYIATEDFSAEELRMYKKRADKIIFFHKDYLRFLILLLLNDPLKFIRFFINHIKMFLKT
ncbi:MAG: radical SAM protein [archaeon]